MKSNDMIGKSKSLSLIIDINNFGLLIWYISASTPFSCSCCFKLLGLKVLPTI